MKLSNESKLYVLKVRNCLTGLIPILSECEAHWRLWREARCWRTRGWIMPPPYEIKRAMLKAEAMRLGATNFVETGTYIGDTLWALRKDFSRLFSIEVQPQLAAIAAKRFRKLPQVTIVTGDSATELASIVKQIDGPCLFWLDGHYSSGITGRGRNDCPIMQELEAIYRGMKYPYSILVDDARCFGTDRAYQSIPELEAVVDRHMAGYKLAIQNDVIFIQNR